MGNEVCQNECFRGVYEEYFQYHCDQKKSFAVAHLPKEMPKYYWQILKSFSKAEMPVSELKVAVENLQYLNRAAFSTDKQLLYEIYSSQGSVQV